MTLSPHATVEITLKDGRKYTLERRGSNTSLMDREELVHQLPEEARGPKTPHYDPEALKRLRLAYPEYNDIPDGELLRLVQAKPEVNDKWKLGGEYFSLPTIIDVRALHGPSYWWWADSVGTRLALLLIALLWIVFYTVRWIIRGFAR